MAGEREDVSLVLADVEGCLEEEDRFFDAFEAGRRGQDCESCPTCLHRGQALSDPGHDARTLKPKISKNGVAERDLLIGTFNTISQRLESKGVSLYR
jgi:hypothetical protein